jgi:DNA adenine methylase
MFPYIGGKSQHIKWLDPLFPEHKQFVEVFGGAGWVSVKSQRIATNSIYNDYNTYLANLYYCMVNHREKLLKLLCDTPHSSTEIFRKFQQELFVDCIAVVPGDIETAMKYIYIQTQVFSGTALSAKCVPYFVNVNSNNKYVSKYDTFKKKLSNDTYCQRLDNIIVENMDCCDVIKKYDSENTFFYIDPPYYNMEFYYSQDFPREKHYELSKLLSSISGKFALSYYDFNELSMLYPDNKYRWHKQDVYRAASTRGSVKKDHNNRGVEVLIMNY